MKKKKAIILCGNTCSGKSTLGKDLQERLLGKYFSFGELKRKEFQIKSELGLALTKSILYGLPINPIHGIALILKYTKDIDGDLIFFSSYPVSIEEYEIFSLFFEVKLIVHLKASERAIQQRYYNRVVCPICNLPGIKGDFCKNHQILMVPRTNTTTLEKRLSIYTTRILPLIDHIKKSENVVEIMFNTTNVKSDKLSKKIANLIRQYER